ncbi:hypothetical protein Cni_G03310 [Canna indica]|uniref:Pentatricopeptide repeat-containing protein n=1 Tax=Canna indica TaxID=4628 RepID=A0AAQ3Q122_9LILI|nr:hypothetical protein Cni_G03310 [Canna indica]
MWSLATDMRSLSLPLTHDTFVVVIEAYDVAALLNRLPKFDCFLDHRRYLESAKEMIQQMTKEGVLPDITTFNSLLEALCKSGETNFCVDLLQNATDMGLCPDISTYKLIKSIGVSLYVPPPEQRQTRRHAGSHCPDFRQE